MEEHPQIAMHRDGEHFPKLRVTADESSWRLENMMTPLIRVVSISDATDFLMAPQDAKASKRKEADALPAVEEPGMKRGGCPTTLVMRSSGCNL